MKLLKIGLRGAVKGRGVTANGANRAGSPLTHDPIMIGLMGQLNSIAVYDTFHRWRAEFLERLDEFLDEKGSERSEDAYNVFRVKMEKLVRSIAKIAHYVNDGNLSLSRVSSKAHGALNEGLIACETIASRLKYLAPPTYVEEGVLGFTKYHTAAVLIRDSFEQFERLNMCKDVLQVLRDKVVDMVAGRHMLAEMDKFRDAIDIFTGLMMENVGLLPVLRKQRQLKPPQPPKALMNEIRGDVLKEALLAKSTGKQKLTKQTSERSLSGHGSSHKPKSSRRSLTDSSENSVSTAADPPSDIQDRNKVGLRRTSSMTKRRSKTSGQIETRSPRRVASMSVVDSSRTAADVLEAKGPRRTLSMRNVNASEETVLMNGRRSEYREKEIHAGRPEELLESRPQRISSFSKRKTRNPQTMTSSSNCNESEKKQSSQRELNDTSLAKIDSGVGHVKPVPKGVTTAVQTGLVKLEPRKLKRLTTTEGRDARDDDDRSIVSISSKKRAKMKAKQARKGKHFGKTSSREKRPHHLRKLHKTKERTEDTDDVIEIGGNSSRNRPSIEPIPEDEEERRASSRMALKTNLAESSPRRSPTSSSSPGDVLRANNSDSCVDGQRVESERSSRKMKTKQSPKDEEFRTTQREMHNDKISLTEIAVSSHKNPNKECTKAEEKAISKPYRYNSSVVDKHKRLMKGMNVPGVADAEATSSKSKQKTPPSSSKVTMQCPPPKQMSTEPFLPKLNKRESVSPKSSRKVASGKKASSLINPKSDGRGQKKPATKSLPSLLDDCSSIEPEGDDDLEIVDILNGSTHSHSSSFEQRRTMFENLGNRSALPLDFRGLDEAEEDIDPLDLLSPKSKSHGVLDASAHSTGLVSEKRSIYENLSASFASFVDFESENDLISSDMQRKDCLEKSLRSQSSQGSVSERRALFEKQGKFGTDGGSSRENTALKDPLELIGRSPGQSSTELAASRTDFALLFFDGNASDDFSSGLNSIRKEPYHLIDQNPWVQQKIRARKDKFSDFPIRNEHSENHDSVAALEKKIADDAASRVKEWPKRSEEHEQSSLMSVTQHRTIGNSISNCQDEEKECRPLTDAIDITPFRSPQNSKPVLRLRMDSPLKKKKPWDKQEEPPNTISTQSEGKKSSEQKSQPWKRESMSELEISLHGAPLKSKKSPTESNPEIIAEAKSIAADESVAGKSALSPEEKGLIVAGEVMKKRVEEEARKKALDQVKEEDRRRAAEEAKRKEEADALRMAEEVFRLEVDGDQSYGENNDIMNARKSPIIRNEPSYKQIRSEKSEYENSYYGNDHLSNSQSRRTKALGSPPDGSQHETYDKPTPFGNYKVFSGQDHLTGAQPWRSKAWGSPLDGSTGQVFDKPTSTVSSMTIAGDGNEVVSKQRIPPTRNRSILSHGSGKSLQIFEDDEMSRSKHGPLPMMKFKPVSMWASPDDDELSHPLKKPREGKSRTAIGTKKPTKPKLERMKPQIADDSSVVKVKKANRSKGEVTYTKKLRPVGSTRKKVTATTGGWSAPLKV